ncbi:CBASS cGAMP-activated phospholipase [Rhodopirellula bahusiensis]|uniref:Patatin n=1 Tax=Rhodopirellula bahusiensis TaxID=2014065 RepID=A0A2G1W5Q5_9BACT|nr:CBASS cGAMP-activated phospholipase [Rhodopirellula bahusiensis]PHQ34367.1 patatin [Rhodopirellula bahusiensis]
MTDQQKFQILSLDGGGIKGLFSAAVLAAVEEDLGISVVNHFDLVTGTSTGGIIALGLASGKRPREIVEFYQRYHRDIFSHQYGWKWTRHWFRPRHKQEPLVEALKSSFQDKKLGECTKRVVIPTYNLGEDNVHLFRTAHHSRLKRDFRYPIWKIALATSSAPTYFQSCREIEGCRLIDGGVWANNPTMVAIAEAVGTLDVPINSIRVLSIGTTDAITNRHKRLDRGGKLSWIRGSEVVDIVMRGQSLGIDNQARLLLGEENYDRWDSKTAKGAFSLDDISKVDDLTSKAAAISRHLMPRFESMFYPHKAEEFVPCNS